MDQSRNVLHGLPAYDLSHDACREVLREIERRGLIGQFEDALYDQIGESNWGTWAILNASPKQKCLAALKAVRESRKAPTP